ncbi:MAG: SPOR domain-containing protein [Alphaproteobacteria bacterium]|nr:SPOR domain-containing protein [Alphaproteobacteria bacterium]
MNQDRDFQQYGFSHYSPQSRPPRHRPGLVERIFGPAIAERLSSPVVATAAFLVVGAAFAGLIFASYPDQKGDDAALPVVQAETYASYKDAPEEGGQAEDSSIFASMRGEAPEESAPVENMLSEESAASQKLEAFAQEMEARDTAVELQNASPQAKIENLLDSAEAEAENVAAVDPRDGVQIVEEVAEERSAPEAVGEVVAERAEVVHKPGSNPETLAFVRSVLDKKDAREAAAVAPKTVHDVSDVAAQAASGVEPAAGFSITAGSHYVQLGSVKSMSGAEAEWGKLQKEYGVLNGVSHRVQSADLGERGVYYRIQAGPMSKDSAGSLCDSIKAQKPGACLVTQ